jgi:SAM-dependent methyltransferase
LDTWKFYDITHRDHVVCNPTSLTKLDEVIALLDLPAAPRVLEIACGKGELLMRIAERWGGLQGRDFEAVAIDISPFVLRDLREAAARRVPRASIEMLEMDGGEYDASPEAFDLALCVGASWTFGTHARTLEALQKTVKPGGKILVGEPFWMREPDPEDLVRSRMNRYEIGSHEGNVAAGVAIGLEPWLALVSSGDDWDRYETVQWRATARWAAANPDDPDRAEVLSRVGAARLEYLHWGRETLGWSLYLFGRP